MPAQCFNEPVPLGSGKVFVEVAGSLVARLTSFQTAAIVFLHSVGEPIPDNFRLLLFAVIIEAGFQMDRIVVVRCVGGYLIQTGRKECRGAAPFRAACPIIGVEPSLDSRRRIGGHPLSASI